MKNEKGITALTMVVTIVIIILLAGAAIFSSRDLLVETNVTTIYNEVNEVREAIKKAKTLIEIDPTSYTEEKFFLGSPIKNSDYNSRVNNELKLNKEYYYLGFNDNEVPDIMKNSLLESLELKSVKHNYLVNMDDIGKVEVYIVDGVRIGDKFYYSYDEIAQTHYNK